MTLSEQRVVRRATMAKRVRKVVEIDRRAPSEPMVVWCELNAEADAIEGAIEDAIQVSGSDGLDDKRAKLLAFSEGDARVLVTKPKIAGFGLNWQHCARVVFAGASHSYEQTYQAIRRCWRFGQTRPVVVSVIRSDREHAVWANYRRKEADAQRMAKAMSHAVTGRNVDAAAREWNDYNPQTRMEVPAWLR